MINLKHVIICDVGPESVIRYGLAMHKFKPENIVVNPTVEFISIDQINKTQKKIDELLLPSKSNCSFVMSKHRNGKWMNIAKRRKKNKMARKAKKHNRK